MSIDDIAAFDFHSHVVENRSISELKRRWIDSHSSVLATDEKNREKIAELFDRQYRHQPMFEGLKQYVSDLYGVGRTVEEIDLAISENSKEGTKKSIRRIMEKENIEKIVVDVSGLNHPPSPNPKLEQYPEGAFLWTMGTDLWLQPKSEIKDIEEAQEEIDRILREALRNGCVGFKTWMAYYRCLDIENVSLEEAKLALSELKQSELGTKRLWGIDIPIGRDQHSQRAIKRFQDFMFIHLCEFAADSNVPILIHTGGVMSPAIDLRKANPIQLYSLFYNPRILKRLPKIVMLHAGYPFHNVTAGIAGQFPNAFVDLSFSTGVRTAIDQVLSTFIGVVPPEKILYGSDASTVTERLGYCANNLRKALSSLREINKDRFGYQTDSFNEVARMILNENSRDLLKQRG
jgi:hypothetical protein